MSTTLAQSVFDRYTVPRTPGMFNGETVEPSALFKRVQNLLASPKTDCIGISVDIGVLSSGDSAMTLKQKYLNFSCKKNAENLKLLASLAKKELSSDDISNGVILTVSTYRELSDVISELDKFKMNEEQPA